MTQFEFESEQAAWEYYLNLDSHHVEEKQHNNNIYTDAFIFGAQWADAHPNPNTIKKIFEFVLEKTNFLMADNLESIDWEVLIKKAME